MADHKHEPTSSMPEVGPNGVSFRERCVCGADRLVEPNKNPTPWRESAPDQSGGGT